MNKRIILLAGATILVASACVKINLEFEVFEDGSAEISGIVALDADAVQEIAESFGDGFGDADLIGSRDELCSDFIDDADLGDLNGEAPGDEQGFSELEAKPYEKDGFCGIEFSGKVAADQVIAGMGGLTGGQDGTLRRDGDGWFFELPLEAEGLGTEGLEGAEDFIDIGDLFGGAEYIVKVKLPGTQVEHNGDFIDEDGAVVWDIDLLAPPDRIFLRTEAGETTTGSTPGGSGGDGGGGGAGLVVIIVVVVLAALGAAAYFLTRKKPEAAVAGAAGGLMPASNAPAAPPAGGTLPVQDFAPPQPTQPEPIPVPEPSPEASSPDKPADPAVIASPTPEQATDSPVWDPARRQYVQWDTSSNGWLVYDDAQQAWRPDTH